MCFSARVETSFREYLRITGAEIDLKQFYEIYGARMADKSVRIPRGVDRNFDNPKSDAERSIKTLIHEYRDVTVSQLETELFAQRKRLAEAERKLLAKDTKAARESQRIATSKVTAALESFYENVERDGRNAVLHFVPPATTMLIACLYSEWVDPRDGKKLLSFAAITDEPPAEVRDAGHDRMIVNIQAQNTGPRLAPAGRPVEKLQAILNDRQMPYYAHEELAA